MSHRAKLAARRKAIAVQLDNLRKSVAKDFAKELDRRQLTQTEAGYITGEAPSQISLVVTGKLRGFSLERLLRMRAMLDSVIKVQILGNAAAPSIIYQSA
jgi:predicted XRE-type DNA-binding protein